MSKLDERKRMTLEEGRKIHEDWLAYIEGGAEVDTESLGDANWHRFAIKDYDAWIAERGTLRKRVEELERELASCAMQINVSGPVSSRIRVLKKHYSDIITEQDAKLQSYRELAEMQKRFHYRQAHPFKVPFKECIDEMCIKARELREMDKGVK